MRKKIYLIVAVAKNGVIGKNNGIPWNFKEDMIFFKKTTENHCVLMGKNTWASLPKKPLKNRVHFIISSNTCKTFEAMTGLSNVDHISSSTIEDHPVMFFNDIPKAIHYWNDQYASYKDLFIVGGGKIYEKFLNEHASLISGVYCTHIKKNVDGDVIFPLEKMIWLSKNVFTISSHKEIDICFYEF